ncbi:hypothetical protein [Pseudodesulfovibrio mercurii]|uniref:hypothetical protein n=1 Tax=Pseudodesulfovibrio mercurii TaxID=641491 RepID=UPI0002F6B1D1|nr:hypothetical protein [Pseudodesulfovibrio mercurii]
MDDFDPIKVFMNDWLKRFLKGNEHIAINKLTPPIHTRNTCREIPEGLSKRSRT